MRVEYDVGDTRYTATLDHSVALCAPVKTYEECPAPTVTGPVSG